MLIRLMICALLLAGCAAGGSERHSDAAALSEPIFPVEQLVDADTFQIWRIKPGVEFERDELPGTDDPADMVRGGVVTGRADILLQADRRRLLKALEAAASREGPSKPCFNPRHAIVAQTGDVRVTIIICFECGLFYSSMHEWTHPYRGIVEMLEPREFEEIYAKYGLSRDR